MDAFWHVINQSKCNPSGTLVVCSEIITTWQILVYLYSENEHTSAEDSGLLVIDMESRPLSP